ncbi:MAG TPA: D-aminoacylase [Thermoanaerobaculia bacterium]
MRAVLVALLALTCSQESPPAQPREQPAPKPHVSNADFDLIVANGDVIDGTGRPRFRADVGVRGDTIVEIGDLRARTAATKLDATGDVVAPGFIDLLGNSQSAVLIDPKLEGKVRQGVTTEVTGEGHSPGPVNDAMAAEMERTKPPGWPDVTWRTLGDFMRVVEKRGSAINFAFYAGAANPREMIIGLGDRPPTADELQKMTAIVDRAMKDGAVGVASALIYPPGRFATTEELTALAKHGGAYWTHLRNESSAIDAAIDEALLIGRNAHVPVNIFHLKVGGRQNWGKMREVVQRIENARKTQDVASCIYPYTATSTDLTSIVPAWALEGGYLQFVAKLKDPATRAKIADALRAGRLAAPGSAAEIVVRGIRSDAMKHYESKRLDEIAAAMHTVPAEAALRLFEASIASPIGIYFSLSEDDMKLALEQPWVAVCSDSGAIVGEAVKSGAHPRAYGTFPRILGVYVRDEKLMPLEEAVRKMTSLAASRAFLADRGILKAGMKADVVVFDPKTIHDVSTYEDPHHFSVGVRDVIVNGTPILRDETMTGALPGKMLKK